MLLLDSTRRLTEMAADAARISPEPTSASGQASWRQVCTTPRVPAEAICPGYASGEMLARDDPRRSDLVALVETAVLGGPGSLDAALTADAQGWSPTFAFQSRLEAERALIDHASSVTPLRFDVDCLFWADPILFAEWHLDATVTDPLLVADDVLVEAQGRPLTLGGASVAVVRDGRIALIHTYFDEAALIEQVILDR